METLEPSHAPFYYWTAVVYVAFLYNALMCVIFVFDNTQGEFFALWFVGNTIADVVNWLDIIVSSKLSK